MTSLENSGGLRGPAYGSSPPHGRRRRRPLWFGRPRFLVVLVVAAAAAAIWEVAGLVVGFVGSDAALGPFGPGGGTVWLGFAMDASLTRATAPLRIGLYVVGGWGLWSMRSWARIAGMVYLGTVLAGSMFWWEPGGYGPGYASFAIFWQISMVPLATFCLMYLYRSPERFEKGEG